MNSIRTKTTLLTVCAIVAAMLIATLLGVVAIRNIGSTNADQMLLLLCESGEKNLDSYFESVEQSVAAVSAYVETDLEGLDPDQLGEHLERAKELFAKMTFKTDGVLTYYYRIDPSVSGTERGFWFVNLNGKGFEEYPVMDLSEYDLEDTSQLVWYTVPRATGEPIWLPPYVTDVLNVRVISFNTPVYQFGRFIGVVGIEIDYSAMADQVDHIALYNNGYAFICDADGNLVYHPRVDVTKLSTQPEIPNGLPGNDKYVRYTYEGVEKQAVWLPLSNGMRLYVTVPVREINAGWHRWVTQIFIVSIGLLAVFIFLTMRFTGHITRPLRELTEVAERLNDGDYDCRLRYDGNDEVGILTAAFNRLTTHLKTYVSDLNDLAYADPLTSVHNRGAFDIYIQKLQTQMQDSDDVLEFAVCMFDCNDLKSVNDRSGRDRGDQYLRDSCALICEVFSHSPVFRIGGDEFAAVMRNADYRNREALLRRFDEGCAGRVAESEHDRSWDRLDIARGVAVYDPRIDRTADDVVRRADRQMQDDKRNSRRPALDGDATDILD